MNADFKEKDQPLAINSRSTDKINNPPAVQSQETRHLTNQSSRNGNWNGIQIYNSLTNRTEMYKEGEDHWTNTGAPHQGGAGHQKIVGKLQREEV